MGPRAIFRRTVLAALAASAVVGATTITQAAAGAAPPLTAPVIHESFTPLGCPASKTQAETTLGLEGCAEQTILKTDAQIDAVAKAIFSLLGTDTARRQFITAQHAWLVYRNADCLSESDKYAGGTLAGVLDAQCTEQRTARHLIEIRAFEKLLKSP
jgi:uncharacterized protein YecT (DUF1311 family)